MSTISGESAGARALPVFIRSSDPVEVGQQPGRFDFPFAQDRGEVGIGTIEQADQQMFDLDIVVSAQSRNASRRLEGTTANIVQASDQWLELYRAHGLSRFFQDIFPGGPAERTDYPATSVRSTREYSIADDDQCLSSL